MVPMHVAAGCSNGNTAPVKVVVHRTDVGQAAVVQRRVASNGGHQDGKVGGECACNDEMMHTVREDDGDSASFGDPAANGLGCDDADNEFEGMLEHELLCGTLDDSKVSAGVSAAATAVAKAVTKPARQTNDNMACTGDCHPYTFNVHVCAARMVIQFWVDHKLDKPLSLEAWQQPWAEEDYYGVLLHMCVLRHGCDDFENPAVSGMLTYQTAKVYMRRLAHIVSKLSGARFEDQVVLGWAALRKLAKQYPGMQRFANTKKAWNLELYKAAKRLLLHWDQIPHNPPKLSCHAGAFYACMPG
jgi:hypothetical protein